MVRFNQIIFEDKGESKVQWRGKVSHVQGGEDQSFSDFNDAVTFIQQKLADLTLEATKEQMTWFADLEKNETGIWWAVCNKDDGTFMGAGGLNDLSKENKKAEIGFWLLPEYWGKGLMTETMPLIFNYAFHTMGLHRIEGFVETENIACKKALKKLQFNLEGTMQDCEIKNDAYISVAIYSKINEL